jgi:hypothetical protein
MTNLRVAAYLGSGEGGGAEPAPHQPTRFRFARVLSNAFSKLRRSRGRSSANLDSSDFQPSLRDSIWRVVTHLFSPEVSLSCRAQSFSAAWYQAGRGNWPRSAALTTVMDLSLLSRPSAPDPDVFPGPGPDPSRDPNPVPLPPPDPDPGLPLDPLPTPAPVY